jgi:ABC-2 type transport system ATP-binding protein
MALAQSPQLLILDEPTLGLDVVARQEFLDAVLFSTETESTVIYCSHQMEEVERLAEQLIIIEKGRLKCQAAPEAFSNRFRSWIVDARFKDLLLEHVPGILNGRVIEGQFHACVLDAGEAVRRRLAALGVDEIACTPVGLDTAVRAFLAVNHSGTRFREQA